MFSYFFKKLRARSERKQFKEFGFKIADFQLSKEVKIRNAQYQFNVQGKNLEQYINKNHPDRLNKIALIKIDAEGYDKEIIKSLPNILRQNRPYLITECFGPSTSEEKLELFTILSKQEYALYRLPGFTFNNVT